MPLRSLRERIVQTLAFEAGGLLLAAPLYALAVGAPAADSALLLVVVAAAVLAWSPLHNSLFDWLDLRLAGRVASERPHRWRLVHALSHEGTSVLVTLPIIAAMTGLGLWGALALDLGLTLFYAAYAYAFHLAFDRLRPVARGRAAPGPRGRAPRPAPRRPDPDAPMPIRPLRERALQSAGFEILALPLALPPLWFLTGLGVAEAALLLIVLAGTLMLWWPLHDTIFDDLDWRLTGRLASDRTPGWRLAHALSREGTATLVTLPVIVAVTGLGLAEAVAIDLGLALFYVAYTYAFHLAFDRLRPVVPAAGGAATGAGTAEPFGVHLMLDGYDADPERLADAEALRALLIDLPARLGMHAIAEPQVVEVGPLNRKDPGGISGVVMIAESHISFHTFPRRGFVTADVYTCQSTLDRDRVVAHLTEAFGIGSADVVVQPRGLRYPDEDRAVEPGLCRA